MHYPAGFPPRLQGSVERALITAERALHRTLAALPPGNTRDTWDVRRSGSGNAVVALVHAVIPSFTAGVCEAIRQGDWSLQRGREAIDEWLKDVLVPHAYTLARLSTYVMVSDFEPFRETLVARVQEADVWGACLDALLEVADESIDRRRIAVGFGRTLRALMDECHWNLADLEQATDIDMKRISGHLYHGVFPQAKTLLTYAQVFSKKLKRRVTVEELRQAHQK